MYLRRASTPKQPENAAPTVVGVVTAATDIGVGKAIGPGMVTVKQVNQDQAPQGAFKNEAECQGWVAISPIAAGDPITQTNVRQQADINALSYKVPQDMRAVTVFVDEVQGVSGLIKPGDRVDVLATFDLKDETAITRTVLQDTLVLALSTTMVAEEAAAAPAAPAAEGDKGKAPAGGAAPPPPAQGDNAKKYPTVTLAVTPGDAQKLVLADSKGKIRLSLRRAGDSTYATVPAANNWELIGQRPAPPEEKPASQAQQAPGAQPAQPAPSWYPSPMGPSPGAAPPGGKPAGTEKPGVEVFRGNQREVVQP
jgi:pilus assembly protein CpaB